jgi:hypothetical protein
MAVIGMTSGVEAGPSHERPSQPAEPVPGTRCCVIAPLSEGGSWSVVIESRDRDLDRDRVISGFVSSSSARDFVEAYEQAGADGVLGGYPLLRLHVATSRWARRHDESRAVGSQVGLHLVH